MHISPEQIKTLSAAIDRIVPRDDFPSASEAGVVDFLLILIQEQDLSETYSTGLDALDLEASTIGFARFADAPEGEQDRVLDRIRRGMTYANWIVPPKEFFELVARQAIEGYYANPGNGGNRDEIGWKMVGFTVTA